jgi:hypothetical protein
MIPFPEIWGQTTDMYCTESPNLSRTGKIFANLAPPTGGAGPNLIYCLRTPLDLALFGRNVWYRRPENDRNSTPENG